jgi:hypothetical protein
MSTDVNARKTKTEFGGITECKHPEDKRYYDWKRTDGFSCGKCGRWIKVGVSA